MITNDLSKKEAKVPIRGMTDRASAFPQIGVIRKGMLTKNAAGVEFPKDLPHFRVVFDEEEREAQVQFEALFTAEPKEIEVYMPFPEPDRCLEAWKEAYVAGAMLHRCDGEWVQRAIDHKTGSVLVAGGLDTKTGKPVRCDGKTPVAVYKDSKGEQKEVFCSPVARMRVIVPALKRMAYLVLLTGSKHDIINLMAQLQAIQDISPRHSLIGIPMMLRRRVKEISTPGPGGKRMRRKKSLLSIEADPKWVAAMLDSMAKNALPEAQAQILLPPVESSIQYPGEEFEDESDGLPEEAVTGEIGGTHLSYEVPEEKPKPTPAKTAPKPNSPKKQADTAKGGLKIVDGMSWRALLEYAVKKGYHTAGDASNGYRLANIFKAEGWKEFKAEDGVRAMVVIDAHYAPDPSAPTTEGDVPF